MDERWMAGILSTAVTLCFAAFVFMAIRGCEATTTATTQQMHDCLASGGSWISANGTQCLRLRGE